MIGQPVNIFSAQTQVIADHDERPSQ